MRSLAFFLALLAPFAAPAAACKWCMLNNQYDGSGSAPPPTHTPADVTKSPKLTPDEVAFILGLENGKRYFRLGGYVADRTIPDLWGRLLDDSALADLLRPRCAKDVAGLRAKAEDKKLAQDDYALAAHYYNDIPMAVAAADLEFLGGLAAAAPAESAPKPGAPASSAKS